MTLSRAGGYPGGSVESQNLLGIQGVAYDMNVACAAGAFGIQAASDAVRRGSERAVWVINPEMCSGHLNWRNRDCHFIFGDAATAVRVEALDDTVSQDRFEVLGTRLLTQFSSNIRNNFGFLNECELEPRRWDAVLFRQDRKSAV